MGIVRRIRHDKENVHSPRPWDNSNTAVKALCAAFERDHHSRLDDSRSAINDFIETPNTTSRTRIGNRELKPILDPPKPPPLVGLPIPNSTNPHPRAPTQKPPSRSPPVPVESVESVESGESVESVERVEEPSPTQLPSPPAPVRSVPSPTASERIIGKPVEMEVEQHNLTHVVTKLPDIHPPDMGLEDPDLMPRFSFRQSVRMPSHSLKDPNRKSYRNSRRLDTAASLKFLPDSSSFLDFDDDSRLMPLNSEKKTVFKEMTFDEADTFDTFDTLVSAEEEGAEEEGAEEDKIEAVVIPALPRPESDESEQAVFPAMSFSRKSGGQVPAMRKRVDDEEDGGLDVPKRMTRRPGAEGALRELQRASITAGREIANSLRIMEQGERKKRPVSKVQGDVMLRSRIFRRWNLRYASIVQQGYFGPVLLLFRPEGRGVASGLALKSSKMIALTDATVRKVETKRADLFSFELKTSQRTYTFGCKDEDGRDFWVRHLGSPEAW